MHYPMTASILLSLLASTAICQKRGKSKLLIFPVPNASLVSYAALQSPNVRYSGLYTIRNCGPNAAKVDAALRSLYNTLLPLIQDAGQSTTSAAHKTFFRNCSSAPYVQDVLSNITTAVKIPPTNTNAPQSPEIACVNKPNELVYSLPGTRGLTDHYDKCVEENIAAALRGKPYIVLCPHFFQIPLAPTKPKCLSVDWRNKYSDKDKGAGLVEFQIFALLHEICSLL